VTRYGYVDSYLVSVSTGEGPAASPDFKLRVQYADQRVSALTLADGRTFRFRFTIPDGGNDISEATVVAPDGSLTRIATPRAR
jgi:hypothetical protein